jgi:hypothetical protein
MHSLTSVNEDDYVFTYDRGDNEHSYLFYIHGENISADTKRGTVYWIGEDGIRRTVDKCPFNLPISAMNHSLEYPSDMKAKDVFKMVTVKDTTFLVNKTLKVTMGKRPYYRYNGYENRYGWYIKKTTDLNGGYLYQYNLNDNSFETRENNTIAVAGDIYQQLSDNGLTPVEPYHGVVIGSQDKIEKAEIWDSSGNTATSNLYKHVERIEDLPNDMDRNNYEFFYYKKNDGLDYYEIYEWFVETDTWELTETTRSEPKGGKLLNEPDTLPAYTYGDGRTISPYLLTKVTEGLKDKGYYVRYDRAEWQEVADPYGKDYFYMHTMPLMIQPDKDIENKFNMSFMELEDKHATVPNPPFVDNHIDDIVYYNGRLGLVSKGSITLSAIIDSERVRFFDRSARDKLDDDPISYGISSAKYEEIINVGTYQLGLYLFTKRGIYINRLIAENGEPMNSIVKVADIDIDYVAVTNGTAYIIAYDRFYTIDQEGALSEVGMHFREIIKSVDEIAVHHQKHIIYLKAKDGRNIYQFSRFGLYRWSFGKNIIKIEVVKNFLVLATEDGIFKINLRDNERVGLIDEWSNGNYDSIVRVPQNIMNDGKTWGKFWWKRMEVFPLYADDEYKFRVNRDDLPSIEINDMQLNHINGHNLDTTIDIISVEDKPLTIDLIQATIDIEYQKRRI